MIILFVFFFFFFFKQKTAYEMRTWLEFRRVLFRSRDERLLQCVGVLGDVADAPGYIPAGDDDETDDRTGEHGVDAPHLAARECKREQRGGHGGRNGDRGGARSEEHTSELQSRPHLVCRLLLEKKKTT